MANRQAFSRSSGLPILAAALLLFCAGRSIAATTTFTGPWVGGTINTNDTVVLNNGASVTGNVVANGTLQFNQSAPSLLTISSTISGGGRLRLTNTGTLNLTGVDPVAVTSVVLEDLTTTVSAGALQIRSGTGILRVGFSRSGHLLVNGGSVSNERAILGDNAGSLGTATVSSGTWASSGGVFVGGGGRGELNVTGGSVTNASASVGDSAGGVGTVTVSGGTWASVNEVFCGKSGTGTLNVTGGRVASFSGYLGANRDSVGTVTVSGGTWAMSSFVDVGHSGTGTLNVTGGSVTVDKDGFLGVSAGSVGTATVSSGTWNNSRHLTVGGEGTGTLSMSGGVVIVGGTLSKGSNGTIDLNSGGTLQIGTGGTTGSLDTNLTNNGTLVFNRLGSSTCSAVISGTGTIMNAGTGTTTLTEATSHVGPLAAPAGRLVVGDSSSVTGFATVSSLSAGSNATLELRSRGLAYVNGLSTLTGGTIRAANGISLGAGANVLGTGAISGDVSGVYGSRIEADGGKLAIGNALSYVGFASDGRLYTNANEVELLDRNLAVLGSLTQLGTGVTGGSLRAVNGMLLEQGKNLVGRGTVYGNFVNQGDVYGDGPTAGQQLVFAAGSTVSGNGSFTNSVFNGTYAPGSSPAITNLTNGAFGSTSTLLIEIGGTQAGAQYDQVQNAGTLSLLGGTLNVVLTNSFMPAPGNTFTILRFGDVSGDFGATVFPVFDNGLGWRRLTTGTAMRVEAAPSAVTINVPVGTRTLASSGYSSLVYATSLAKSGTGALVLDGTTFLAGPTSIQQGSIRVAHAAALATSTVTPLAGGTLSLTPTLQWYVGGLNPNAGGLVDVGTGLVTVASGLSASDLVAALLSGRAGGSWDGSSGITSSAAAASGGSRTVGWLDNGDGSVTAAYAAAGDTNLDWTIDILDVSNFVAGGRFNSGLPATWAEGDFNYDGFADILDVADFASSGLFNAGPYNAATGAISAVPEPSVTAFAALGLGLLGLRALRRE